MSALRATTLARRLAACPAASTWTPAFRAAAVTGVRSPPRRSLSVARRAESGAGDAPAAVADAPPPAAADAGDAADAPLPTKLDIRVGRILEVDVHPDADGLYIEQVDLGDPEGPRTIVSGLVAYVPRDQLDGRLVVALCNLKARNMRGVKSDGMLLCASNADHTAVEPLDPPAGSQPGDRLGFDADGARPGEAPAPASPNQVAKKKVWEGVQPDLATSGDRVAMWKGAAMVGPGGGVVTCASLGGGSIS